MSERILKEQLEAWNQKPALRFLYKQWFRTIQEHLVPGLTLEVGGGIGRLKEYLPELITLDIENTPWTDIVADAKALPVKKESFNNIVLFDVLHHLPRPVLFFRQAERALAPGGRILIMDPYASPASSMVYRFFHPEPLSFDCDPYNEQKPLSSDIPFDSNQAAATIMFFRQRRKWNEMFPNLKVTKRSRTALFAYPLTGGFGGKPYLPEPCILFVAWAEKYLRFLAPVFAFRTFIVLSKQ
ncbi:MAG: class I SAM-dependent methyltransferase [Thermodesulfobacteriota bacterium]|nr:class I SAM-dependent methyltransferase [Thermodesulfobacteriota bacterium]